jgi:hypothetical protein
VTNKYRYLDYVALQQRLAARAANYSQSYASLFRRPNLSNPEWVQLLRMAYPQLQSLRQQSAEASRQFYDRERQVYHPELPRFERPLERTDFRGFLKAMDPVRQRMLEPETPEPVVAEFTLRFTRSVEMAGRRQMIDMVESDEAVAEKLADRPARALVDVNQPVQRWARVATGRETCAWCLMLVSRGPVYRSARSGGSKFDDESTVRAYVSDSDISEFMNEWHVGCDCKVVPVFDLADWPGQEAQGKAEDLWIEASGRADEELAANPDKKYYSHKESRWLPTTKNRETINQLRKMLEAGEISPSDWAVLHQAA